MAKLACLYFIFIYVVIYFASVFAKSKTIEASLNSKWKNTPIILEASEYMAEESNEHFWKFVDHIVNFQLYESEQAPRMLHDSAIKAVTMTLGNDKLKLNLLKFALGLRMYSPKIEMFYQLAQDVVPSECNVFFDVHGQTTCDVNMVKSLLSRSKEEIAPTSNPTFQLDHVYPGSASNSDVLILYGDITSEKFREAHEFAKALSNEGICKYVLRHFVQLRSIGTSKLSGYGIELAIKSTEYKASDDSDVKDNDESSSSIDDKDISIDGFDFATLRHLHPNLSLELTELRNHLIDSTNEMQPMKVWQLQDLSFQAAARVLSSPVDEQLELLQDISQNFPLRVRTLVKQQVSEELRKEIKKNQQALSAFDVEAGESLFLMNGLQIDFSDTDIFELVDMLRTEGKLINGLKKLNVLGTDHLQRIMKLNVHSETADKYHLDFRDPSIIWANDIEQDEKYARWPSNVHELLRPAFPGTLRRIRKNIFHLILVIDPENEKTKHLIETAEIFWANDVPLRIGFSFLVNDSEDIDGNSDVGVALLRAYNYARDELDDNGLSFSFLTGIFKSLKEKEALTVDHIITRLRKKFKSADVEEILGSSSEFDGSRKLSKAFNTKSGLTGPINVLFNGDLLSNDDVTSSDFEQSVIERILESFPLLQRAAYMGELTNEMVVLDFLMNRPNVVPRFNDRILLSSDRYLVLLGRSKPETIQGDGKEFGKLNSDDKTATVSEQLKDKYLSKSDRTKYVRPVSMWVVTDLSSSQGRSLFYNGLKHIKSSSLSRVAVIHNPVSCDQPSKLKIAIAVEAALRFLPDNHARNFITKLIKEENAARIESGTKSFSNFYVGGMDEKGFEEELRASQEKILSSIRAQCDWSTSTLRLHPGQRTVVANGKVYDALNPDEVFLADDFLLIESLLYTTSVQPVQDSIKQLLLKAPQMSDLIMKISSHLASQPKSEIQRRDLSPPHDEHSVIKIAGSEGAHSSYDIVVVLDPASDKAQEIIPITKVLQEVLDANVRIYMNCREKLSDLPVKRFYRFVLETGMNFKVENSHSDGPMAKFDDMPSKSILTLNVRPPEGWMVEAVKAVNDLDNIKLEEVSSKGVSAEYELEHIVLEGHARDLTTGSHPRGLQFTLGRTPDTAQVDTIVMANLGYFQLKASPGVWYLNLREGPSRDIYQISSHENTESLPGRDDPIVLIDSFKSKVIIVKVTKKADKMDEALLDEKDEGAEPKEEEGGIWNSLASTFTGGSKDETHPPANSSDVINIFSLASGHLYERLMRIMMLSVISKTQTKVKFWVLKNYLSPQFKDFIPYMAAKYGFEYELVQYKWPRWLRQQNEKQRTMWGYKILFLDVLFPLDVDKIIFVDADQIVRADLKELRDLDLEGNPYGYTPFCSDRKEMDGFRFWKGGYWANHLAGRKYHISAIYVVDLKKFRKIAAGDRLRGQYQGLSQDPNSLANLDQDLPNNMIHQVGIKSLPQEWLWCATWCSEESKARAKTIDLCNNPLTKEPKLQAAVRIVPEWTGYDEEVKALQVEFNERNKTQKTSKNNDKPVEAEPKSLHTEL